MGFLKKGRFGKAKQKAVPAEQKNAPTKENELPKVGNSGPDYIRLLAIERSKRTDEYFEQYYTVDLRNNSLCLTDHSYAGGYGGGYTDYVDELVRPHISAEEFKDYCRRSSRALIEFFSGLDQQNLEEYIDKIKALPSKNLAWQVGEPILHRWDFAIIKPIRAYDSACVYLARYEGRDALILETLAYTGCPMLRQDYSLLKHVDAEHDSVEDMTAYAAGVIYNLYRKATVANVKLSPVVQQHYWQCSAVLERDRDEWWISITDVFAINRWQDEDAGCREKLPKEFPDMTAVELARFINGISPCGPKDDGYRNVKPEEAEPLLQAARNFLKTEDNRNA